MLNNRKDNFNNLFQIKNKCKNILEFDLKFLKTSFKWKMGIFTLIAV